MNDLLAGFSVLWSSDMIVWVVIGVVLGFIVGILPGFIASNAIALALPFSLTLSPQNALALILAVYAGSAFGGSMPAILMNVPGTPESAATALDGYPMAQAGKADKAVGIARMASVFGGVFGAVVVLMVTGPLSSIALLFGSRELFFVVLLGLLIISTVVGNNVLKGVASGLIGLLIAAMSVHPVTGQSRLDFGFLELYEGIPLVPAIVGLFAFTQMFLLINKPSVLKDIKKEGTGPKIKGSLKQVGSGLRTTLKYPWALLRSATIGTGLGVLPGVGTTVGNFVSYGIA